MGPRPRKPSGPAVMTAQTGRTQDCTRPSTPNPHKSLATREPSTQDVPLSATSAARLLRAHSRRSRCLMLLPKPDLCSGSGLLLRDTLLEYANSSGGGCLCPESDHAAAFEQLVGAEVKRPGRARTGGCACACALRRRSRWRPPARSAARPAHPPRSAARSLARCGLPPAAFR